MAVRWPFILLGGMNQKLNMGEYLEYPKYGSETTTVGNLPRLDAVRRV